ncbi:MAG: Flp pilus assembly complex ATPase component TadA [Blastocatellia bacterium]|nr:Flp pilus assembly complex ATPase component TadA [Blastocatellia bacterium]
MDINTLKASIMTKEEEETELRKIEKSFRESTIGRFKKLLAFSIEAEVTDIILAAGNNYFWRSAKTLQKGSTGIWTAKELEVVANFLLTGDPMSKLDQNEIFLCAETSYQIMLPDLFPPSYEDYLDNKNKNDDNNDDDNNDKTKQNELYDYEPKQPQRFRASIFKEKGQFCIVLRVIPTEMRTIRELNLPALLETLANSQRGLILITGATGQGKSTTISAMLEHINKTRVANIITLEDPIEFIYKPKNALLIQREVAGDNRYSYDAKDYPTGIKEALRQSPDVIMVGEIRDAATFEAVLTAADSGHLVISAIHTADVATTLEKIISYYPEGSNVLRRLSRSLKAIISQRLVPANLSKIDAERVPALEILHVTQEMKHYFASPENIDELKKKMSERDNNSTLQNFSDESNLRTFDQYLIHLVKENLITIDTAMDYATSPGEVQAFLTRLGKFIKF